MVSPPSQTFLYWLVLYTSSQLFQIKFCNSNTCATPALSLVLLQVSSTFTSLEKFNLKNLQLRKRKSTKSLLKISDTRREQKQSMTMSHPIVAKEAFLRQAWSRLPETGRDGCSYQSFTLTVSSTCWSEWPSMWPWLCNPSTWSRLLSLNQPKSNQHPRPWPSFHWFHTRCKFCSASSFNQAWTKWSRIASFPWWLLFSLSQSAPSPWHS